MIETASSRVLIVSFIVRHLVTPSLLLDEDSWKQWAQIKGSVCNYNIFSYEQYSDLLLLDISCEEKVKKSSKFHILIMI